MIFHHIAIYSRNPKLSMNFYLSFFDFQVVKQLESEGKIVGYHLKQDNSNFILEILKSDKPVINSPFHIAFFVEDVPLFYNKYHNQLKFIKQPFCLGNENIAFISDLDGYQIEINDNI